MHVFAGSYFLLPTSCFLLPTSYFLLPTSHILLPTSYFLLPTTYLPHSRCGLAHLSRCSLARGRVRLRVPPTLASAYPRAPSLLPSLLPSSARGCSMSCARQTDGFLLSARTGRRHVRATALHHLLSSRVGSSRVKSGQVRSSRVKSGQVGSSRVKSGQVGSSWVKSGQVGSSRVKSGQVGSSLKSAPLLHLLKSSQLKSHKSSQVSQVKSHKSSQVKSHKSSLTSQVPILHLLCLLRHGFRPRRSPPAHPQSARRAHQERGRLAFPGPWTRWGPPPAALPAATPGSPGDRNLSEVGSRK